MGLVGDVVSVVFGEEPETSDAFRRIIQRKWVAIVYLVASSMVTVGDTISDVAVTIQWYNDLDRIYARLSGAILVMSAAVSSLYALGSFNEAQSESAPGEGSSRVMMLLFGLFSLVDLQTLPWAAHILWLVWTGSMRPERVFCTEHFLGFAAAKNPIFRFKLAKVLEFVLEASLEIVLQTTAVAYGYFVQDKAPSIALRCSIALSVLSISAGMSTTYLCYETAKNQILGGFFFAGALVARVAVFVFGFVEYGGYACAIFAAVVFASRAAILAYVDWFSLTRDFRDQNKWTGKCCGTFWNVLLYVVLTIPTLVVEAIVPLGVRRRGYRDDSTGVIDTVFWGTIDREPGDAVALAITEFGNPEDCQGVRSRLASPVATVVIALHVLENLVVLAVLAAVPNANRSEVGAGYLVVFVVGPMLVSAAAYERINRATKNIEARWKDQVYAVAARLAEGSSPLAESFDASSSPDFDVSATLFGDEATLETCERLKEDIDAGTLNDPRRRKALDLLVIGRARVHLHAGGDGRRQQPNEAV